MLRPAGCSSGWGVCARGGGAIGKRVEPLRLRCAQPPPLSGEVSLQATEGLFPARRVLRVVHARHPFLLPCFAFGSRLSLFLCQEKRDGLRYVAFLFRRGSGSPYCVLECRTVIRLVWFTSGLCVSLWRSRRSYGETWGRGERSRRRGRVRFCVSLLALPCFPRGIRWGLRAPKPAPKSHWLSGLSSWGSRQSTSLPDIAITAIPESPLSRSAVLGYTERPARVQFMLGQVGLYSDHINTHERPDSKHPQALKSRVAAREAVWKRALPAVREAVRKRHCGRVSGERSGTACLLPWTRCRPARTRACAPRRHRGSGSSSRRRSEPRRQTYGRTARPRRCPP